MAMGGLESSTSAARLAAYARILDLLPAAGSLCRPDGVLVYYSPQAAALWGHRPALDAAAPRYCGAHRAYAADGSPLAPERSPTARALAERTAVHGQHVEIERPDGTRRMAVAHASPLLDDDGELLGVVGLLVDVTDRHLATHAQAERLRQREEARVALACDIRAGLDPLRRSAQDLAVRTPPGDASADLLDRQLRHVTGLVDRLLNLEVDLDDAIA